MHRTLELVIIGDELLSGLVADSNVSWLARKLAGIGLSVSRVTFAPDEPSSLFRILDEALSRSGTVISCGGLGPTSDDSTRAVAAGLFGRKLHLHKRLLASLRRRYKKLGRTLSPLGATQAEVPRGARLLSNPSGAAPGIILRDAGRTLILLPGVPAEVRAITDAGLLTYLRELLPSELEHSALVRTAGLAETELAERAAPLFSAMPGLKVAYLPKGGTVDLVLKSVSSRELSYALRSLEKILAEDIYAIGERSLAEVTGELLFEEKSTLSVAESCTGGMLASAIVDVPGSSKYFLGGIISYSNEAKEAFVDVPHELLVKHGAVSREAARAMAEGVRTRFGSTFGIAITGIAGPGGGTKDKPVGLVYIALASPDDVTIDKYVFSGSRNVIRERSVVRALDLLRRTLLQGLDSD